MFVRVSAIGLVLCAVAMPAAAQQAPNGEAVFKQSCATCHRDGQSDAPTRDALRQMTPEAIFNALTLGRMILQATALSEAEQRAVSVFLAGTALRATVTAGRREPVHVVAADARPGERRWMERLGQRRRQHAVSVSGERRPHRGRPAEAEAEVGVRLLRRHVGARAADVAGGRLFVASENGEIHALDPKTGLHALDVQGAGRRAHGAVGRARTRRDRHVAATPCSSATRAPTSTRWTRTPASRSGSARLTSIGPPRSPARPPYHGGRVFVGVQGLNEEGQGGNAKYECCTFRGSVSALDANTGQVLWKTYTIDEPKPRGKNKDGVQQWGPAGGGIWSAPTVDPKRNMVYVATGNNYADPSQKTTDAVIALDMNSGTRKWVNQTHAERQLDAGLRRR